MDSYSVHVLVDGYSRIGENGSMLANGTSTLILGSKLKVSTLKGLSHEN